MRSREKRGTSKRRSKRRDETDGTADSILDINLKTSYQEKIRAYVLSRDPDQPEFLQAVLEMAGSLETLFESNPTYFETFKILCEPERIITFRVPWLDDEQNLHINRGWRVQFNQCLGPYKGGLRFHPTANLSILKFLGFEQTFKNALTGLPLGGGKGGSDFDPKGKSDREVLKFCQSFMTELSKYIGQNIDVPAGDIGVGEREIGYLFGHFKRMRGSHEGTLTGKGVGYGGTLGRSSSTGYGLIYILQNCLESLGDSIVGKRINISGSGNVALYAARKAIRLGATVQTLSDSNGFIFCEDGLNETQLDEIIILKTKTRGRLSEIELDRIAYYQHGKSWQIPCDVALPCATQNELDLNDAKQLVENGCRFVFEGANMPSTAEAIDHFKSSKCVFVPGKAANAGGVAGSGFEMTQNSQRLYWTESEFDEKLKSTMSQIWKTVSETAAELGHSGDYLLGANCAGFKTVADAMLAHGFC